MGTPFRCISEPRKSSQIYVTVSSFPLSPTFFLPFFQLAEQLWTTSVTNCPTVEHRLENDTDGDAVHLHSVTSPGQGDLSRVRLTWQQSSQPGRAEVGCHMSEVALEVGGSFRSHQEPSKSEERRAANSGHREGPQFVCWLNACMLKSRTMAVSTPGTSRECFKSKAMLYGRGGEFLGKSKDLTQTTVDISLEQLAASTNSK